MDSTASSFSGPDVRLKWPAGLLNRLAVCFETMKKLDMAVASAESCSSGLLAALLTTLSGSSAVFRGGVVCYHDQIKASQLAVSETLLAQHGAVSAPVAEAMASGVRTRFSASFGLSTTGLAGPASDASNQAVGTVWVALSGPRQTISRRYNLHGSRSTIRLLAAAEAALVLTEVVQRTAR